MGLHSSVCGIWHALDWHTWWHSLKWNDFKIKRSNNLDILYSTCILCSYIKASHRFDLMMQESTLWYFWDGSFSLKSTCIVSTCFSKSNTKMTALVLLSIIDVEIESVKGRRVLWMDKRLHFPARLGWWHTVVVAVVAVAVLVVVSAVTASCKHWHRGVGRGAWRRVVAWNQQNVLKRQSQSLN